MANPAPLGREEYATPAGQGLKSLWLVAAAHHISGQAMHGMIPVPRAGECFTQCRAGNSDWPSQPSGAAPQPLPDRQHARQRRPRSLCYSSSTHGSAQNCRPSAEVRGVWRRSRCMGLHVLVGLISLAAQRLSLGQRGRMCLLAALAAVLVVTQLLVRSRLLLPASAKGFNAIAGRRPCSAASQQCQSGSWLADLTAVIGVTWLSCTLGSDPPPVMACSCTAKM